MNGLSLCECKLFAVQKMRGVFCCGVKVALTFCENKSTTISKQDF